MQETNMRNFLQATDNEVYMCAKFEHLTIYRFLYLNTSIFGL
jgi:hypothetical protein